MGGLEIWALTHGPLVDKQAVVKSKAPWLFSLYFIASWAHFLIFSVLRCTLVGRIWNFPQEITFIRNVHYSRIWQWSEHGIWAITSSMLSNVYLWFNIPSFSSPIKLSPVKIPLKGRTWRLFSAKMHRRRLCCLPKMISRASTCPNASCLRICAVRGGLLQQSFLGVTSSG